jgi:3,4-dihydroxy-9,10-secoandrosta-1,3,5(10)-triene-9,17-dione 4,5-dioxygenase
MTVVALSYLVLDSCDVEAWERFGSEVLGMQAVRRVGSSVLRMDGRQQRFVIRRAATQGLGAVGWDVADGEDLGRLRTTLTAAGAAISEASDDELEARAVDGMIWTCDPDGNRVEFVYGAHSSDTPTPGGSPTRFVTGGLGMGHLVLMAKDMPAMRNFYEKVLGFGLSDYTKGERMVVPALQPAPSQLGPPRRRRQWPQPRDGRG